MKTKSLFHIRKTGIWAPGDIVTCITKPGATLTRSEASEAVIEEKWQALLQTGFKPWKTDTSPTSYRFAGFRAQGRKLVVTLDPCLSYRDRIGSRSFEFSDRFDRKFHPLPLAVTTVLLAKDSHGQEHFLVTVRDDKQDVKPGGFHVSTAGVTSITKDQTPTDTAYREALEECGATRDDIADMTLRAVVHGPWTVHTEMIYFARLKPSAEDILVRSLGQEEDRVVFIPLATEHITYMLLTMLHSAVPVGAAALVLLGESILGGEEGVRWRRRMDAYVCGASAGYRALSDQERQVVDKCANEKMAKFLDV